MDKKLLIIGAGGHGKVIADIAKLNGYKEIAFLDDDTTKKKNGKYDVINTTAAIDEYINDYDFFVGIGDNQIRKKVTLKLKQKNIVQPVLIHPSAIVDESVVIEQGTVVMANVVINADAKIKEGCIINTASSIDHDCIIDSYVHISPGVHIAGTVKIGELTWVGIGASVRNNTVICANSIIGAGSVVVNDILEKGTYVGIPTKKVHS